MAARKARKSTVKASSSRPRGGSKAKGTKASRTRAAAASPRKSARKGGEATKKKTAAKGTAAKKLTKATRAAAKPKKSTKAAAKAPATKRATKAAAKRAKTSRKSAVKPKAVKTKAIKAKAVKTKAVKTKAAKSKTLKTKAPKRVERRLVKAKAPVSKVQKGKAKSKAVKLKTAKPVEAPKKAAKLKVTKTTKLKAAEPSKRKKVLAAKAQKAEKITAAKLRKAEELSAAKAAKQQRADEAKAAKTAQKEKARAEKLAKAERLKADKLAKAEAAKAAKTAAAEKKRAARLPAPKGDSRGADSRREAPKAAATPVPPRPRMPIVRAVPVSLPVEPPRPTLEERAERVSARLEAQSEDIKREYAERLYMSWIHHDSALEGVVYSFQELQLAIDPTITVVPDSSLQPICDEIRRHKAAIDYVREAAADKSQTLNMDIVKRIYLLLHPEEGDLKTVKYRKDVPQHRLYFHEYAPPDKVPYLVRQVVDWVNDPETRRTRTIVRIAARAHYDLLRAFPFQQDSGKVARLVMNYILLRAGYPPAIVHSTERQRYYEALKGSPLAIVHMVQEALENSIASIEKYLDERTTRVRSFVS